MISRDILRKMRDMGLTLDQAIELLDAMSAKEPSAAARRQRAYRERHQNITRDVTGDETRDATERDEPPLSLSPPPQTPPPHTHTPPEYTTRAKGRATRRCPEDWGPSLDTHGKLISEGFTAGDLERALTRMRDHEFKTARLDWDATFRNWVRTDADRKPPTRISPNGLPAPDAKRIAREENLRRAYAGSEMALGGRS